MWIYEQTKSEENFLCCRRRSAYRCKQQSLPFRLYRHRQLNRQSN